MQIDEKIYTVDDLWELSHLPENELKRFELVKGVIIEMHPPGFVHGETATEIAFHFRQFVGERNLGSVTVETGYRLHVDDNGKETVRAPDVAFIAAERIPQPKTETYMPVPPDIAVEVVSPNDSAVEVNDKVNEYLRCGVKIVWLVYPRTHEVHVFTTRTTARFTDADTLDGGDVLPGFTLPVRDIFPK